MITGAHSNKSFFYGVSVSLLLTLVSVIGYLVISPLPADEAVFVQSISNEPLPTFVSPPEWVPELPVRLVIPALELDALIQYVGLAADGSGEMAVPSNFTDVGWYASGVRPGMRGSAVMAGHFNGKGIPEGVFFKLNTLQVGDEVVVMSKDRVEDIFQVVKVVSYEYDAPTEDIFISDDGKKRLNLITCGGRWLADKKVYSQRVVVFTELLTDVE